MPNLSPSASTSASTYSLSGAVPVMAEQCTAHGASGAVSAAAPGAALVGAEALRSGGNAYDAVVAAALVETVLLPPKCGLGGDLVALAWRRGDNLPESLLAIGRAPGRLALLARRGELQTTGPTSVGVPAAPAGYLELAKRGKLSLERLAQPAIDLAENGFPWSRICSSLSAESCELVARYDPRTRYYPNGQVIQPGTVTKLPGLADLLREYVATREDFLLGQAGDAILDCVTEHGGILNKDDLRTASAEWTTPQQGRLGDMPIYATPAPTHGPVLLKALRRISNAGGKPATAIHSKVMEAIEWRRRELADPSGTSMVSAVDENGTMVTVVHSNSYPRFGSGLIVSKYDLILANRAGRGFSTEPGHPNFPVSGRWPVTTLHVWAVRAAGNLRIQGATPGGANQMPWNAQTLARMAAGQAEIGRLIAAPRWEWVPKDDSIRIEHGFSSAELEWLIATGATVVLLGRWAVRSAMQIIADDPDKGLFSAAADPRTVGAAIAF